MSKRNKERLYLVAVGITGTLTALRCIDLFYLYF